MNIIVKKKYIKHTPDKVRLIINLIRKMNVYQAINQLTFVNKSACKPVIEILKSSISAAKEKDLNLNNLIIKEIRCDEGPRLKRRRIIHRGRATAISKRLCHIYLKIGDMNNIPNLKNKNQEKKWDKK